MYNSDVINREYYSFNNNTLTFFKIHVRKSSSWLTEGRWSYQGARSCIDVRRGTLVRPSPFRLEKSPYGLYCACVTINQTNNIGYNLFQIYVALIRAFSVLNCFFSKPVKYMYHTWRAVLISGKKSVYYYGTH